MPHERVSVVRATTTPFASVKSGLSGGLARRCHGAATGVADSALAETHSGPGETKTTDETKIDLLLRHLYLVTGSSKAVMVELLGRYSNWTYWTDHIEQLGQSDKLGGPGADTTRDSATTA